MLIKIILGLALTAAGTRWIDFLYGMPEAPLSFPNEIERRAKFRLPLLTILMSANVFAFADVQAPLSIYLMAANFFLALIIFTDFEQYVIFNKMLAPFALVGVLAVVHLNLPVVERILAAAIGGGLFLLISILTRGGIGGGDIKLVAALGIWLGAEVLLNVVIMACVLGGIVALILILAKLKDRKSYFAYGPYFSLAAMYFLSAARALQ